MDKRIWERERKGVKRGAGGFPQGKKFSTGSYPQVWITLGISPVYGAGEGGGGVDILSRQSAAVGNQFL